jgi:hypothetical protein
VGGVVNREGRPVVGWIESNMSRAVLILGSRRDEAGEAEYTMGVDNTGAGRAFTWWTVVRLRNRSKCIGSGLITSLGAARLACENCARAYEQERVRKTEKP